MRKALVTFFTILMSCVVSFGQYNYNNIVLFDCTKSMTHPNAVTREDYRGEGEPDIIWKPAKMALKDLFIQAEDEDNFTILLFQESILDIIEGKKKNLNWSDIDRRLESAVQKPDDTCICGAWDKAETYLREGVGEFNFFYLFTDGCEDCNYPSHDVTDKIRKFCKNQRTDIRKFGFYLMLTEKAGNKGVKQALEGSCIKSFIPNPGATIHPFGAFVNRTISVSTDDMMSSMGTYDRVASVSNRFSRKKASYPLDVTSSDPHFNVEVQNNCIDNGEVVFLVSAKDKNININDLRNATQSDVYRFKVPLSSTEVELYDDSQEIVVNLKPIRSVEVRGDYIKFGTADYYPRFMFFPEKEIKKLSKTIDVRFSKSILSDSRPGVIRWEIFPQKSSCTFYYNGKECQDNAFYMTSEDGAHELELLFDNKTDEGDFEFALKPVSVNGIEFINGQDPLRFEFKIYSKFDVEWHPVLKMFITLLVIGLICCILRILYSHLRRGVYCGVDYIDNGSLEILVPKRTCNRIILIDTPKRQGVIDYIFNGRTLYNVEPIPGLRTPVRLNAYKHRRGMMYMRFSPNKDFLYDSVNIRNQTIIADEDTQHTITDRNNNQILTFILY